VNWVLLIGFAGLGLTIIGAAFGVVLKQAVSETRLTERLASIEKGLGEIKAEHIRSAADQGVRLEALRDDVGTLMDFKARTEGAAAERDMSGVVRR
jgi:hypothetical protein